MMEIINFQQGGTVITTFQIMRVAKQSLEDGRKWGTNGGSIVNSM